MKMTKQEVEDLRQQAIKAEQRRIDHINAFLENHPLDTDMNKAIALELATSAAFIEQIIMKLEKG